jgi:prepilin-type N-terminal cleavage/methylation domain-containing protein
MILAKRKMHLLVDPGGFTLVEVMIALFVASLVMGGVITSFIAQQDVQSREEQIVGMQQNLRVGMNLLLEEARMAGANPWQDTRDPSCNKNGAGAAVSPRIHTASATEFGFSMDLDGDGDCNSEGENVIYHLYNDSEGVPTLGRQTPTTNVGKADYIDAIGFYYTLTNGSQVASPAPSQLDKIRAVEVSLLARTEHSVKGYRNTHTYTYGSGNAWDLNGASPGNTPGDSYRRQLLSVQVTCRNMGL